jgi:beta-phosphoglucomutase-like phosphatase (HAD superfamily)
MMPNKMADGMSDGLIRSVVFDVGETLLDDTREFGAWADWIGVPRHTFSTVLGAVTFQGRDNAETFQYFQPGFDLRMERERREAAGNGERIENEDLYPDARAALAQLRSRGLWVGVAGNQTKRAANLLRAGRATFPQAPRIWPAATGAAAADTTRWSGGARVGSSMRVGVG